MTANTPAYINFVTELMEPVDGIASGRFFGGTGLTCNGVQFAMLGPRQECFNR